MLCGSSLLVCSLPTPFFVAYSLSLLASLLAAERGERGRRRKQHKWKRMEKHHPEAKKKRRAVFLLVGKTCTKEVSKVGLIIMERSRSLRGTTERQYEEEKTAWKKKRKKFSLKTKKEERNRSPTPCAPWIARRKTTDRNSSSSSSSLSLVSSSTVFSSCLFFCSFYLCKHSRFPRREVLIFHRTTDQVIFRGKKERSYLVEEEREKREVPLEWKEKTTAMARRRQKGGLAVWTEIGKEKERRESRTTKREWW